MKLKKLLKKVSSKRLITVLAAIIFCLPVFCNAIESVVTVWVSYANIRQEPSIRSQKIGFARSGENFFVMESKNSWLRILLPNGKSGWIHRSVIKQLRNVGEEFPDISMTVKDVGFLPVFEEPDIFSRRLKILKEGDEISVNAMKNGWLRTNIDSETSGWVPDKEIVKELSSTARDVTSIQEKVFLKILRLLKDYNYEKLFQPKFQEVKWYPSLTIFNNKQNVQICFNDIFNASIFVNIYVQKVSTQNFFPLKEKTAIFMPNSDKVFFAILLRELLEEPYCDAASINLFLLKEHQPNKNNDGERDYFWDSVGTISLERDVIDKLNAEGVQAAAIWEHLSYNSISESAWK